MDVALGQTGVGTHGVECGGKKRIGLAAYQKKTLQQWRLATVVLPEEKIHLRQAFDLATMNAPEIIYLDALYHSNNNNNPSCKNTAF